MTGRFSTSEDVFKKLVRDGLNEKDSDQERVAAIVKEVGFLEMDKITVV